MTEDEIKVRQSIRRQVAKQIEELQAKAVARPGAQDPLGMVGYTASLMAAKLQVLLLEGMMEEKDDEKEG